MRTAKTLAEFPFCEKDARYEGAVEVVELNTDGISTVGLRLRVRKRAPVPLPRNRVAEVIAALTAASKEASNKYQDIIEEMNRHE